jgi:hypothetical protein
VNWVKIAQDTYDKMKEDKDKKSNLLDTPSTV